MIDTDNETGILFQEALRLAVKGLDIETGCPFLGALRKEMRKLMNEGEVGIASTDKSEDGTGDTAFQKAMELVSVEYPTLRKFTQNETERLLRKGGE